MSLDMAYLAAGRLDVLYSSANLNEWDVAAGMLLIKEAGGVLLNKDGKPISDYHDLAIMTNISLCEMAPKLVQI